MRSLKKTLSLLLALVMAMSCMSLGAMAYDDSDAVVLGASATATSPVYSASDWANSWNATYDSNTKTMTLNEDVTLETFCIVVSDITIDLNGHNICTSGTVNRAIYVDNGATLTIKDSENSGMIQASQTTGIAVFVRENSTLNLESGKLSAGSSAICTAGSDATSYVNISGGELDAKLQVQGTPVITISGGTFSVAPSESYVAGGKSVYLTSNGQFEVANTGSYVALNTIEIAVPVDETLALPTATDDSGTIAWSTNSGDFTISGATITGVSATSEPVIVSGTANNKPAVIKVNVIESSVAEVYDGETLVSYAKDIEQAINVCPDNGTIKLTADVTANNGSTNGFLWVSGKDVTIDLNNNTMTGGNFYGNITVASGDTMTVKNGTLVSISTAGTFANGSGTLNIDNVTMNGTVSNAAMLLWSGELNITDSTINETGSNQWLDITSINTDNVVFNVSGSNARGFRLNDSTGARQNSLIKNTTFNITGYNAGGVWTYDASGAEKDMTFENVTMFVNGNHATGVWLNSSDRTWKESVHFKGDNNFYYGASASNNSALIDIGGPNIEIAAEISGGTYTGAIKNTSTKSTLTITGGTFNFDPTTYVDTDNYTVTDNGNGTWTVTGNAVASTGTGDSKTTYSTVEAAIENVSENTEIAVTASTTLGDSDSAAKIPVAADSTVTVDSKATAAAENSAVTAQEVTITSANNEETKAYVVGNGTNYAALAEQVITKHESVKKTVDEAANATKVSEYVNIAQVLANAVAAKNIDVSSISSMELRLDKTDNTASATLGGNDGETKAALQAKLSDNSVTVYDVKPIATVTTTTTGEESVTYEYDASKEVTGSFTFKLHVSDNAADAGKTANLTHYHNENGSWTATPIPGCIVDSDGNVTVTLDKFSYITVDGLGYEVFGEIYDFDAVFGNKNEFNITFLYDESIRDNLDGYAVKLYLDDNGTERELTETSENDYLNSDITTYKTEGVKTGSSGAKYQVFTVKMFAKYFASDIIVKLVKDNEAMNITSYNNSNFGISAGVGTQFGYSMVDFIDLKIAGFNAVSDSANAAKYTTLKSAITAYGSALSALD